MYGNQTSITISTQELREDEISEDAYRIRVSTCIHRFFKEII